MILKEEMCIRDSDYPKDSIMVTHDAARIFVTPKLIKDSIRYAKQYGARCV